MRGVNRPLTAVGVAVIAVVCALGDPSGVAAQVDPGVAPPTPSSSSSVPVDPAIPTSPAIPGETPGTTLDGLPVDPNTITATTAADPLLGSPEGLSSGSYGGQPAFDLGSMAVLGSQLGQARRVLAEAQKRFDVAQAAIGATVSDFQRLAGEIEQVGVEREDRIADASAAKTSLRKRMIAAYVRGDQAGQLLGVMDDPIDYSRGKRYLEALAGLDHEAYETYQNRIAGLDDAERSLVDGQADLQISVDAMKAERSIALDSLLDARRCADAYAQASHACPPTFTFPVLGEVTFSDGWGASRLLGGPDQHWHEGTDIMAPQGREVVAVENGTLFKVGTQGLGGLRLWLHGESGIDYYYAHFSSVAPVSVDGAAVTAGTVVGYVGSTGDAAGGASHLHFEIHPQGGAPVDPYPLLKVTWGARPMASQASIMQRVASVTGTLPPEER